MLVMLISPQDRPGDHLRALENVSRSLKDDAFVKALRASVVAPTRSGRSCPHRSGRADSGLLPS